MHVLSSCVREHTTKGQSTSVGASERFGNAKCACGSERARQILDIRALGCTSLSAEALRMRKHRPSPRRLHESSGSTWTKPQFKSTGPDQKAGFADTQTRFTPQASHCVVLGVASWGASPLKDHTATTNRCKDASSVRLHSHIWLRRAHHTSQQSLHNAHCLPQGRIQCEPLRRVTKLHHLRQVRKG